MLGQIADIAVIPITYSFVAPIKIVQGPSMASDSTFRFVCPECSYKARMPRKYLGLAIKCPKCSAKVRAEDNDDASSTGHTAAVTKVDKSDIQPAGNKFRFECNSCGYRARMPVKYMGMAIKCPKCGNAQMAQPNEGEEQSGQTVAVRNVEKAVADKFLFQCDECGYRARLPTKYEDQHIQCPGCKTTILATRASDGPPTGDTVTVTRVEPGQEASPMGEAHGSSIHAAPPAPTSRKDTLNLEEPEDEETPEPRITGLDHGGTSQTATQTTAEPTTTQTPTHSESLSTSNNDDNLNLGEPLSNPDQGNQLDLGAPIPDDTASEDVDVAIPSNFATSSDTLKPQRADDASPLVSEPARNNTEEMLEELRSTSNKAPTTEARKHSSRQVQVSHQFDSTPSTAATTTTNNRSLFMTVSLGLLFLATLIFGGMWFITQKNFEEAQATIDKRDMTIKGLRTDLSKTQTSLNNTQSKLTTTEDTLKTTDEELTSTQTTLESTKATLNETQDTLATRIEELTASQNAINRLRISKDQLEADLADKLAQVNKLNTDIKLAEETRLELESQIEKLKRISQDVSGLNNARNSASIMAKTKENTELRQQVTRVESQLADSNQRLETALNRAQTTEIEATDLKSQLGAARAKIIELEALVSKKK